MEYTPDKEMSEAMDNVYIYIDRLMDKYPIEQWNSKLLDYIYPMPTHDVAEHKNRKYLGVFIAILIATLPFKKYFECRSIIYHCAKNIIGLNDETNLLVGLD